MMASIDSSIFEISTPISTARCCTRLTEVRDSTSSVMLAMPVIRSPPCSQRGSMEICRSTSLLSHSSDVPIHWHSGFRVQRRQDHQLRGVFSVPVKEFLDKSNIMNIALAIPLSQDILHETRGISTCSTPRTALSTTREINAVEKESIFLVACIEECWVRLARSHCVNELVLGRHVQDPICVDVESDLNLR